MKQLTNTFLIISLTFWSGCMLYGQSKIDSLYQLIQSAPEAESSIENYLSISREWLIVDHDSAEYFIE